MKEPKTLKQLAIPITLETLCYMLAGMIDTLMLSSVGDEAVGLQHAGEGLGQN